MNRPNVSEFIRSIKKVLQPVVSPSGDRIVYVVTDIDPDTLESRSYLVIANFDGSDTRRITALGTSPSSLVWSPDGGSIVYAAALSGYMGFGVFSVPVQGGEPLKLGRCESTPSDFAFAPDGRSIAFVATHDPNKQESTSRLSPVRVITRVDYKEDGFGIPNEQHFQIFLLDLETSEIRKLTEGRFDHAALTWSPDGTTLGSTQRTRIGLTSQVFLIDIGSGKLELIGPEDHAVRGWSWSPDGSSILKFRSPHPAYDGDFYLWNLESHAERRLSRRA